VVARLQPYISGLNPRTDSARLAGAHLACPPPGCCRATSARPAAPTGSTGRAGEAHGVKLRR